MNINIKKVGIMPDGRDIMAYTMAAESGYAATILNLGGTLQRLIVPDKAGNPLDVVTGYDDPGTYIGNGAYFGALVGRCANRIAGGRFTLDGKTYDLYQNNGENSLHGGKLGFSFRLWDVTASVKEGNGILTCTFFSPDGDENYPGNLTTTVTYILQEQGSLSIHYKAVTDAATVVNLTNHTYFNLDGYANGGIQKQTLWMDCDRFNEVDETLIPTGKLLPVKGTPYDFTVAKEIGRDFGSDYPHMVQCRGGYDTNFFVRDYTGDLRHIATLTGQSGRTMRVYTDQPCMQVYTGNFLSPENPMLKGDVKCYQYAAVALETQAMPDAINQPGFTEVVLRPGEEYNRTTVFDFSGK